MIPISPASKFLHRDNKRDRVTSQGEILLAKLLQLSSKQIEIRDNKALRNLLADPARLSQLVRYAGLSEDLNAALLKEAEFGNGIGIEKFHAKVTSDLVGVKAMPYLHGAAYEIKSLDETETRDRAPQYRPETKHLPQFENMSTDRLTAFVPSKLDFENTIDCLNNDAGRNQFEEDAARSSFPVNGNVASDLSGISRSLHLPTLILMSSVLAFLGLILYFRLHTFN